MKNLLIEVFIKIKKIFQGDELVVWEENLTYEVFKKHIKKLGAEKVCVDYVKNAFSELNAENEEQKEYFKETIRKSGSEGIAIAPVNNENDADATKLYIIGTNKLDERIASKLSDKMIIIKVDEEIKK